MILVCKPKPYKERPTRAQTCKTLTMVQIRGYELFNKRIKGGRYMLNTATPRDKALPESVSSFHHICIQWQAHVG